MFSYNMPVHYLGPNPSTGSHPASVWPKVAADSFVSPFSSIIGDVTVGPKVFIAPLVSVRADEGSPFHIGEGSNLQDGVILHGLKEGRVRVNGRLYSIYLDRNVTAAHGAIIHGPAALGSGAFVGFQSLVFQAVVGADVYIANNAVVSGKVTIADGRFVPPGAIIDTQEKADLLGPRPESAAEFARAVQAINRDFAAGYSLMFGKSRCTCGLACEA